MSTWPNRVALGGFLADNDATDFRLTSKLTGWDDAPPASSGISSRSQADGGWDASGYYEPRVVTLEGMVEQPTPEAAAQVKDTLTALSPRSIHELVVDNAAVGPRSAMTRVTIPAVIEWLDDLAFTYTMTVTAPDPLKYGSATFGSTQLSSATIGTGRVWSRVWPRDWGVPPGVLPGAVALPNAGTTSYFPRLRIDGYVSNPVLTLAETGDFLRVNGSIDTGQWLDIDLANRRVLLNGKVSQRHRVTYGGNWLAVPVGGGTVTWSADAYNSSHRLSCWGYEGAWI